MDTKLRAFRGLFEGVPQFVKHHSFFMNPGIKSNFLVGIAKEESTTNPLNQYNYHRTSASFNKRCRIGEVVVATAANCSTMGAQAEAPIELTAEFGQIARQVPVADRMASPVKNVFNIAQNDVEPFKHTAIGVATIHIGGHLVVSAARCVAPD